jgi:hypothetical protein
LVCGLTPADSGIDYAAIIAPSEKDNRPRHARVQAR